MRFRTELDHARRARRSEGRQTTAIIGQAAVSVIAIFATTWAAVDGPTVQIGVAAGSAVAIVAATCVVFRWLR